MTSPVSVPVYTRGYGVSPSQVPYISTSNPSSSSVIGPNGPFQLGQRWINTNARTTYTLTALSSSNGVVSAIWSVEGSGGVNGGFPITPYVVGPVGQAGYQTIQSAINAANAAGGGQVWVQAGSYTENLTFFSGIQLSGPSEQSVTIIGTHTPPSSGTLNLDRVTFQSSTHIFSSSASGTCTIIMEDTTVNVMNGYTFNLPNWTSGGQIQCFNIGPGGTNDGFINNTGGTVVAIYAAGVGNGTANPMILSGSCTIGPGTTFGCPVNLVTGANFSSTNNQYYGGTFTFSNNSTGVFYNDSFVTGSSPCITQSSSGTISLSNVTINSSNNPAITGAGAGAITLSGVSFLSNSSYAGTLTLSTISVFVGGEMRSNADIGGSSGFTSLTNANSTTIAAGTGTVKMSSANNANNAAWIKIYIGTTAYWIPAWLTNSP